MFFSFFYWFTIIAQASEVSLAYIISFYEDYYYYNMALQAEAKR